MKGCEHVCFSWCILPKCFPNALKQSPVPLATHVRPPASLQTLWLCHLSHCRWAVQPRGATWVASSYMMGKLHMPPSASSDLPLGPFLPIYLVRMNAGFGDSPTYVTWDKSLNHSRSLMYPSYHVTVFWTQYFPPKDESMPRANCEILYHLLPSSFLCCSFPAPSPPPPAGGLALCLSSWPWPQGPVHASTVSGLTVDAPPFSQENDFNLPWGFLETKPLSEF